jgi:O-antigen/teichoic acid export membrane protein
MTNQKKMGEAVFWSVFAKGARFVLGLISSVIVVRGLGEYDYGVLSLVRTLLAFVVVATSVGLGQSLLNFLPVMRVAGDSQQARALVGRIFLIQSGVWAILFLATFGLADSLEGLFGMSGLGMILVVAIALAAFELYFNLVTQVLNAHYDTKLLSAASVTSHVVLIVGILIGLPRGWGVVGVIGAAAAGQLIASLMLLGKLLRTLSAPTADSVAGADTIERGRLLRFSLPFALIGLLNMIVWRQSETLFLAHYRGAVETGFFDLAYRLPQTILEFVPGTIWPIVLAGFSEAYARDAGNLRRLIDRYYKMLFLLSTPICLLGVTLGGRMVPILFGEAMAPAAVPTQLFFVIFTVSFFGTPLSMALYVMEKSHINLLVYLVLAVINIGLDLILIPRYGLIGAIVPVAFVIVLPPFIYGHIVGRLVGGLSLPFRFIGRCFLASSPALLMLPLLSLIRGIPELILAFVFGGTLILLTVKRLKLIGKEEADMLGSIPIPAARRILQFVSA